MAEAIKKFLPYPLPPWEHDFRTLAVHCAVNEASLRPFIPPTLELISDRIHIAVMRFDCQVPDRLYYDAAVLAKVRYKKVTGGFWAFAFTSTDQVMSGTREIWGYNMKLADMSIVERPERIEARCLRLGKTIISLDVNLNNQVFEAEDMYEYPRIFLKGIPDKDHVEGFRQDVVTMNCRPDEIQTHIYGTGEVSFEPSEDDPLHTLDITEVFGATFTTGHQTLPWGQVLA